VKGLIFDMDGLMIDSERLYFQVEREMARAWGKDVTGETLKKMMGRNPEESIQIYVNDLDISLPAAEVLNQRNARMKEKLQAELQPMPGFYHILSHFRSRLLMAVATAAQQEFLDIVIDKLAVRQYFKILQSSDEISKGKPDPEIYMVVCDKMGLSTDQCMVLEDSQNGALAGKRAGCYVIAVPSVYTQEHNFDCVDFVADDLFSACQHIEKLIQDIKDLDAINQ
jgi:HAD superfamily hydrolase (TIGR01509 family)